MKRKEFLTTACTYGICSCAGVSLLMNGSLLAASGQDKKKEKDWRFGFMQKRFAKLIDIIDSTVDQEQEIKIIESLGRACAKDNSEFYAKYKDHPEDYLAEIEKKWADRTEYDKETGTIKIVGKKAEACFCPLVDGSMMSKDFCNCSRGFNKEVFETILGKSVEVTIGESVLYGGERCVHVIKVV